MNHKFLLSLISVVSASLLACSGQITGVDGPDEPLSTISDAAATSDTASGKDSDIATVAKDASTSPACSDACAQNGNELLLYRTVYDHTATGCWSVCGDTRIASGPRPVDEACGACLVANGQAECNSFDLNRQKICGGYLSCLSAHCVKK